MALKHDKGRRFSGLLTRLRRNQRGNVLIMTAFALIPMLAMTGAAIDMSRIYVVRVRLQQACDAGVLAGRKFMDTTNTSATLDTNAASQARLFFGNNYHNGWYGTSNPVFTPTKTSDSQVSGTATTTVPMAVMQMFGARAVSLNVACQARYDIADADVMFVLDTTGSMACLTSDSQSTCDSYASNLSNIVQNPDGSYAVTEKTSSRISGLRSAVLSFFDTVTSSADASTNFRFGFVPYSATVNVGSLLQPKGYMVSGNQQYQSRTVIGDATSGPPSVTNATTTSANCSTGVTRSPNTANTYTSSGTATVTTVTYNSGTCKTSAQTMVPNWQYNPVSYDVTSYVMGNSVTNPAQVTGAISTWKGCIEERMSTSGETGSSFSATSPPLSLDVDTVPTSSAQRWKPMWQDAEFARLNNGESSSASRTITARPISSTQMYEGYAVITNELPCPLGASRLTTMPLPAGSSSSTKATLRSQMQTYMSASNGFRPYGVTYHDVGMTWGTRLLAPNGPFASDTTAWSGHNSPNRFIIFLTDGTMETDPFAYTMNGIEAYDNRTGASTNNTTLVANHNARFATACTIAKNRNIKIFVIAYSQTLTTQLTACASPGSAYYAADTAGLNTAFASIAQQVAMLRISQ